MYVCIYTNVYCINVPHINENVRPTLAYEAPVTLHNTLVIINKVLMNIETKHAHHLRVKNTLVIYVNWSFFK
jgi:hypothetical protein